MPTHNCLVLPKEGYTKEECEDSIHIHPLHRNPVDNYKFAIADGATESSFSKEWATLLTGSIQSKAKISTNHLLSLLPNLQAKWKEDVFSRSLPYYSEIKALQGAYSALAVLNINIKHSQFTCLAVGDCCLFHVRYSALVKAFPITKSEDFNNNPFLISSIQSKNAGLKDCIKEIHGEFTKGDKFFLMSDAIASWFLKGCEQNEKPWEIILRLFTDKILDENVFVNWVQDLRKTRLIKNDDTSIISIEI
jgi:hypothetical protein